ncbi:LPXTG cell wall anchor domain-containing protein [Streptomyces sp. NPDC003077]|uniref:LPXTG cell wall anchor domain-containing protein n=1 Tax=Streptomyces sp. NPDC003077 TaxID=3154443 RepID=UPI0033B12BBC
MKLRHTVATAVAVATLAPAALLVAPAAYAAEGTQATQGATRTEEKVPGCETVSTAYGDYEQKTLTLNQTDVDGPVVRGGGWRNFHATVTNISNKDVTTLNAAVYTWRQVEDEDPVVASFVDVEYKNRETGKWIPLGYYEHFVRNGVLKAKKSVTYDLRLRAKADLPAHMTWADVSVEVSFVDSYRFPKPDGRVVPCLGSSTGQKSIKFVNATDKPAPTGKPKPPTTSTPKPSTSATTTPKPTAPVTHTPTSSPVPTKPTAPVTARPSAPYASPSVVAVAAQFPTGGGGNLAQTGSSDALPTVGLIGGAAVLAGGAAVLITRRRRTN